jgi:hypothetical protein
MDDYMELGESGLVPHKDGWFFEKSTGMFIDPDGKRHFEFKEDDDAE